MTYQINSSRPNRLTPLRPALDILLVRSKTNRTSSNRASLDRRVEPSSIDKPLFNSNEHQTSPPIVALDVSGLP